MLSGCLAFTHTVLESLLPWNLLCVTGTLILQLNHSPSPSLGAVRQVPQRSYSLAHLWPLVFPLCRTSKEAPFRIAL